MMTSDWLFGRPDRVVSMSRPLSLNRLWIRAAGKPRARSQEYRAWAEEAGWHVRRQVMGAEPIDCRFNVLIEVPISRRDTGNFEKAILDLCESCGVITNDGNAHEILVRPTKRDDVMVAFFLLPEMGQVRARPTVRPKRAVGSWRLPR